MATIKNNKKGTVKMSVQLGRITLTVSTKNFYEHLIIKLNDNFKQIAYAEKITIEKTLRAMTIEQIEDKTKEGNLESFLMKALSTVSAKAKDVISGMEEVPSCLKDIQRSNATLEVLEDVKNIVAELLIEKEETTIETIQATETTIETIKEVYGADLNTLRTNETKEEDKKIRRKKRFKNSFLIDRNLYLEKVNSYGDIRNHSLNRAIEEKFVIESNGCLGYILTPR